LIGAASTLIAAEDALLEALSSSRAPPLIQLAIPLYRREFRSQITVEGEIVLNLDKRGYRRYKARPRKTSPPPVDTDAIRDTFNNALAASPFYVSMVTDEGLNIKIKMEVLI